MRVVLIADTHERHRKVTVPDGDVLIHAGDFTMMGEEWAIVDFNSWLGSLPHKHKIVIAGNHEVQWNDHKRSLLTNCTYLEDSGCEVEGLKFWGSPYTPTFFDWAFMLPRGQTILEKWLTIPHDTDVLITHGPPKGILDTSRPGGFNCGCDDLRLVVSTMENLKLHVFGHIHGGTGFIKIGNTAFVNASVVDEAYQPRKTAPLVVDL